MRCKPVFTTYSEGEPSPTNISSTTSGILRYISDSPDARTAGARQEPRVARDSDGGSNEFVSTCTFCPSRLLVRRRLSNETPRHWRRWDIISPQTTLQPTASDNYAAAQLDLRLKDRWPRWSVRQVGLYSHTQARSLVLKAMSWSLKRVRTMCSDANTILYCTSSAHLYNLCLCFTFVLRWPYAVDRDIQIQELTISCLSLQALFSFFLFLMVGSTLFVNNPTFFVRDGGKGGVNVGKNIFVSRTVLLSLNVFVV